MTGTDVRKVAVVVTLLLGAAAPLRAAANPPDDAKRTAVRLLDEGVARFGARDYAGALEKFQAAHRAFPSPKIYLNIGEALRNLDRPAEAAEAFYRFIQETDRHERKRPVALHALAELTPRVGRLLVEAGAPDVSITLGGQPVTVRAGHPLWVMPGKYRLGASAPGHTTVTQEVTIAAGEERRVRLTLAVIVVAPAPVAPPASPERGPRIVWTWVLGSTTVALLAVGVGLGVKARSGYHDYQRTTDPERYDALRDQVKLDATLANVFYATAGAAAVATGLVYFLVERPRARRVERRVSLGPAPGGSFGLGLQGRY